MVIALHEHWKICINWIQNKWTCRRWSLINWKSYYFAQTTPVLIYQCPRYAMNINQCHLLSICKRVRTILLHSKGPPASFFFVRVMEDWDKALWNIRPKMKINQDWDKGHIRKGNERPYWFQYWNQKFDEVLLFIFVPWQHNLSLGNKPESVICIR